MLDHPRTVYIPSTYRPHTIHVPSTYHPRAVRVLCIVCHVVCCVVCLLVPSPYRPWPLDLGAQVENDVLVFKGSESKGSQWCKTKLNLCDGLPGLVTLEPSSSKTTPATLSVYPDTSKLYTIQTLVTHMNATNTVAYVHHSLVFPYLSDVADKDALWSKPEHTHRRLWLLDEDFQTAGGLASAFDISHDEFRPLKPRKKA